MTTKYRKKLIVSLAHLVGIGITASARGSELDELKATIQSMQKNMEQMQKKIAELEQENHKQKKQAAATIIKEANPPQLAGSATGVVNFINFSLSALLGPVFGARLTRSPGDTEVVGLAHHQAGFTPLLYGILSALILTFFLKETGPATRKT